MAKMLFRYTAAHSKYTVLRSPLHDAMYCCPFLKSVRQSPRPTPINRDLLH